MQLQLTDHDARALYDLLRDSLPALQRETVRTDSKEYRHRLLEREALIERVLAELAPAVEVAAIP